MAQTVKSLFAISVTSAVITLFFPMSFDREILELSFPGDSSLMILKIGMIFGFPKWNTLSLKK
jgi:hypothetical protein